MQRVNHNINHRAMKGKTMPRREFLVGQRIYPTLIIHAQENRAFESKYLTLE
jgi:hypothetical protein